MPDAPRGRTGPRKLIQTKLHFGGADVEPRITQQVGEGNLETVPEENHVNIAGRFIDLCFKLDGVKGSYRREVPPHSPSKDYPPATPTEPYLLTHLRDWVRRHCLGREKRELRTGGYHDTMARHGSDGRRQLPVQLCRAIRRSVDPAFPERAKVEVKWIVCYLADIRPDQTLSNWRMLECSHRCINWGLVSEECITPTCLVWESKADNQSRGGSSPLCMHSCSHCGQPLCCCQNLHMPCCL